MRDFGGTLAALRRPESVQKVIANYPALAPELAVSHLLHQHPKLILIEVRTGAFDSSRYVVANSLATCLVQGPIQTFITLKLTLNLQKNRPAAEESTSPHV